MSEREVGFWYSVGWMHAYQDRFEPPRSNGRDCIKHYLNGWGAGIIASIQDHIKTQEQTK
jgi:hypothetical protein